MVNLNTVPKKLCHNGFSSHILAMHVDRRYCPRPTCFCAAKSYITQWGILVHSVNRDRSGCFSKSFHNQASHIGALTFHQFFEGMGLGGCITQARITIKYVVWMRAFFALTTPGGIATGIGITGSYSETSPTALIVHGVMNAAAAGILIYMSLVDLLAAIFMDHKLQENACSSFRPIYVALLLGAGAMSAIAKWA